MPAPMVAASATAILIDIDLSTFARAALIRGLNCPTNPAKSRVAVSPTYF